MASRETRQERGRRRGDDVLRRLVSELRTARQAAGLSQKAVAGDAGWTQSELHRLERHEFSSVSLPRLAAVASVLGYELSANLYPIGAGLHDRGQQALLSRLEMHVHALFEKTREVPFPNVHDLRSWDLVLKLGSFLVGVEAETRVRDIQELVRRVRQREADGGVDEILIVLSDSAHNRLVVDELREALGARYAASPRLLLKALRSGQPLPASGVILI